MNKRKKYFTTGDVARYCEVDINTVKRWIRAGSLRAFKTPSGHYRVPKNNFVAFLEEQGFPYVPRELGADHLVDILIVEDDPVQMDLLTFMIDEFNGDLKIGTAQNSFEGYMKAKQSIPRLVILDLVMPHISGLDFLRVMRESEDLADTRVLVISAHLDEAIRKEIEELGVKAVLEKPIKVRQFIAKCDEILGDVMTERRK